jgi:hypothetical protein
VRSSMVPTSPALVTPGEGCRIRVPRAEASFESDLELVHGEVVHPVIDASIEKPKERLCQVQPRTVSRRVAQDDVVAALRRGCPGMDLSGVVNVEVVQHNVQPSVGWQTRQFAIQRWQQEGEHGCLASIRAQHRDNVSVARVQQRQELARAQVAAIRRALTAWSSAQLPTAATMWNGLQGPVFVETHHSMRTGGVLQRGIGFLDERAFSASLGSVLAQNERSACQLSPASTKKRRTVVGSMWSSPGSRRSRP